MGTVISASATPHHGLDLGGGECTCIVDERTTVPSVHFKWGERYRKWGQLYRS